MEQVDDIKVVLFHNLRSLLYLMPVSLNPNPLHSVIPLFPGLVFMLSVTSIRGGLVDEWAFCEGCFVYS